MIKPKGLYIDFHHVYLWESVEFRRNVTPLEKKLMVKHKKKYPSRRKNFVAIPFFAELLLSTLADDTVIKVSMLSQNFGEDIFCISVDVLASIVDLTAGEVPLIFGVAHNDLTVSEILEFLDSELTDPDDLIQKERSRRPVRRIGVFSKGSVSEIELNDGKKIRQTMKFSVGDGHNVALFIANRSGATLTTGAGLKVSGTLFGRWQR